MIFKYSGAYLSTLYVFVCVRAKYFTWQFFLLFELMTISDNTRTREKKTHQETRYNTQKKNEIVITGTMVNVLIHTRDNHISVTIWIPCASSLSRNILKLFLSNEIQQFPNCRKNGRIFSSLRSRRFRKSQRIGYFHSWSYVFEMAGNKSKEINQKLVIIPSMRQTQFNLKAIETAHSRAQR